jgi:hypothetical protein
MKKEPDEQRVSEVTGNEGASFERSYRRAAIVIWDEQRYPEVCYRRELKQPFRILGNGSKKPPRDARVLKVSNRADRSHPWQFSLSIAGQPGRILTPPGGMQET